MNLIFELEYKVNLIEQDRFDQYLYPKRNICVLEQQSTVRQYPVVGVFSIDRAIRLKRKSVFFYFKLKLYLKKKNKRTIIICMTFFL